MKILNRTYLVLAVVFLFIGVDRIASWSGQDGFALGQLILLLPSAVFAAVYLSTKKHPGKWQHFLAICLCFFVIGVWGLIALTSDVIDQVTTEVTDQGRYIELLNDVSEYDKNLVSQFPRGIPPDATHVRFSYLPAFLQGGMHIQLRCDMPPARITELYERFSKMKTKSFFGGGTNDHMNMDDGMPTTFFYTDGSSDNSFPKDFEIMIFDPLVKKENIDWNHGESHGVAISKARNQIVYWAEAW